LLTITVHHPDGSGSPILRQDKVPTAAGGQEKTSRSRRPWKSAPRPRRRLMGCRVNGTEGHRSTLCRAVGLTSWL